MTPPEIQWHDAETHEIVDVPFGLLDASWVGGQTGVKFKCYPRLARRGQAVSWVIEATDTAREYLLSQDVPVWETKVQAFMANGSFCEHPKDASTIYARLQTPAPTK